ncbi:non-ribosomal peptide synthetase [Burkholderia sp. LMG 21824]|uniref:non-ribosomal peptide synthetase n=1 Tax=Burkholderia sp. LMG 21824 TaxID=3158172 RepID=UPI003C2DA0D9
MSIFEERLSEICECFGTRIALSSASTSWSYRDMYAQVRLTSLYLQGEGIRPGARVGLICGRSPELVILMLALLSIEAAYVPLDPMYPVTLIERLIVTADVEHVIVDEDVVAAHLDVARQNGVSIHAARPSTDMGNVRQIVKTARACNPLAYAICTSGSTGNPKVVSVTLESLLASTAARTKFYASHRMPLKNLLISSVAFDSSIGVIFGSLFAGDELLLATNADIKDPRRLLELIVRESVTSLLILPSYVRVLYEFEDSRQAFEQLERLIFAGERVLASDVDQVFERAPQIHVYNEYGPTEAVVWAAATSLVPRKYGPGTVPIGCAVNHVEAYILDDELRPVPDGREGEIYVGGASIASGYLNDPRQTAERFIPNPFSRHQGSRMYKTGDRAMMGADGQIVFTGRADRQIKLYGYRIELGEIEIAAMSLPGIKAAAAVYAPAPKDRVELFVVASLSIKQIRDRLESRLPEHMMPGRVELVKRFALLPNGKVDYGVLTQCHIAADNGVAEEPPDSGLESKIRGIWETVLQEREISLDDDFFELGGSSIKAAMIANRIQRLLSCRIYVGQLFEQPTIRGLCVYLRSTFPLAVRELERQ